MKLEQLLRRVVPHMSLSSDQLIERARKRRETDRGMERKKERQRKRVNKERE